MPSLAPPFQFEWPTVEGFGTERMVARPLGHGAGEPSIGLAPIITEDRLRHMLTDFKVPRLIERFIEGDMAIKQIAFLLGYSQVGNFTAAVTCRFGVPPGNYRKAAVINHSMICKSS